METVASDDDWVDPMTENGNTNPDQQDDETTSIKPAATKPVEDASFEPQYEFVDVWLSDWLLKIAAPRYLHGEFRWCEQWYRHPDVAARLAALWLAWEHDFAEPIADGSKEDSTFKSLASRNHWWVYHYANQMPHIFGEHSSMRQCQPNIHKDLQPPLKIKTRPVATTKRHAGVV